MSRPTVNTNQRQTDGHITMSAMSYIYWSHVVTAVLGIVFFLNLDLQYYFSTFLIWSGPRDIIRVNFRPGSFIECIILTVQNFKNR